MEIGSVTGITFTGDKVEVLMEVGRANQSRITSTSVASLGSVSLLGEAAVDITASSGGMPVPEGGVIPSGPATGTIGDVTTQASAAIEQTAAFVADLRAGRGTLGQLVADDRLYRELTALVGAAEDVARGMADGRGTLGRLANDPAAARALEGSLENLQAVTARIRAGEGSIGKLLNDDALSRSLTSMTTNLDSITGRINKGEGTAGRLVNDTQLYDRLNSLSDRIDTVMAGLQKGEGTAGQLLRDRQLYENINGTMVELKGLVSDIRKDPRKYLSVRVSIF
jgi:phospholipid/cholesterol/gamma-HCH transport system substrate-binding protein